MINNFMDKLVVVGDSFAALNAKWKDEDHFSYQVAECMGIPVDVLARGGSDSIYIHAQMKYAVESLGATHLIIWQTTPERFAFPFSANAPLKMGFELNSETCEGMYARVNGNVTANQFLSHQNPDERNYQYPDYDPVYVSDHANCIFLPGRNKISRQWRNAYGHYISQLFDDGLAHYVRKALCESMYNYCNFHKIKTVIVDKYYAFGGEEYRMDLLPSKHVTMLTDPTINFKLGQYYSDSSPNHMTLEGQKYLTKVIYDAMSSMKN